MSATERIRDVQMTEREEYYVEISVWRSTLNEDGNRLGDDKQLWFETGGVFDTEDEADAVASKLLRIVQAP